MNKNWESQIPTNHLWFLTGSLTKRRIFSREKYDMFLHPRETPKKIKVNPEPLPRHKKIYSGKNSLFIPSHPCQSSLAKPEVIDSPLNSKIVNKLQSILSTGLSDSSWSKYKTAYNHLKSVEWYRARYVPSSLWAIRALVCVLHFDNKGCYSKNNWRLYSWPKNVTSCSWNSHSVSKHSTCQSGSKLAKKFCKKKWHFYSF